MKIAKFIRISFLTEHLRWLLLYRFKLHLYRLRILLTIPLEFNIIPCLFQLNFVFFLPSFSFFTPSKRIQNSFTTTRQILDVFFIFIFIYIVIYTSLFTLNCLYLFTLAYLYHTHVLFILLYYYMNLIKLLKYGECRNYDKILLESISSIEDSYSFTI